MGMMMLMILMMMMMMALFYNTAWCIGCHANAMLMLMLCYAMLMLC